MKSDFSIYFGKIIGYVIIIVGFIIGYGIFSAYKNAVLATIILVLGIIVGQYFIFKSKRRRGHIIYSGGSI